MNWKLDKYYSFKELPLPEKIWVIFLFTIIISFVILCFLFLDFRKLNKEFWFPIGYLYFLVFPLYV